MHGSGCWHGNSDGRGLAVLVMPPNDPLSIKCHRLPPTIIRDAVWLCARFTLPNRDIEEMLAERGADVSCETVRS